MHNASACDLLFLSITGDGSIMVEVNEIRLNLSNVYEDKV